MLLAAAIGDEKRFDLDLGLDEDEPAPAGRPDRVPVEERPASSTRRPRRTPTWMPRRALLVGVVSLRPARRCATRRWRSDGAILASETADVPAARRCWSRARGRQAAGHRQPQLLLARRRSRRWAPRQATRAGAAWPRARAGDHDALMPDRGDCRRTGRVVRGRQARADRLAPANRRRRRSFGFDAVRTLVRFAEDPDPAGRRIAARAWPVFEGRRARRHRRSSTTCPSGQPAGSRSIRWRSSPRRARPTRPATRRRGRSCSTRRRRSIAAHPTYYGAAWVALGRIMLDTQPLRLLAERVSPTARSTLARRSAPPRVGRCRALGHAAADRRSSSASGTSGRCSRTDGGGGVRPGPTSSPSRPVSRANGGNAGQHLEEHARRGRRRRRATRSRCPRSARGRRSRWSRASARRRSARRRVRRAWSARSRSGSVVLRASR